MIRIKTEFNCKELQNEIAKGIAECNCKRLMSFEVVLT